MVKKIIIMIIIIQIIFIPVSIEVNAFSLNDIIEQGDNFLSQGKENNTNAPVIDEGELSDEIGAIYNILLTLGVAISVVVGAILGIKFIVGSVEEQAKIKEMLIPYVLGCVVVFGAFGIWKMTIEFGEEVVSATELPPTPAYTTKTGRWAWCKECDEEVSVLTGTEGINDIQCSIDKDHTIYERTARYFCGTCGDEWDEGERRQQGCDQCRSR